MVRAAPPKHAPREDDSKEQLPLSELPARPSGKRPKRSGKQTEIPRRDEDSETINTQTRLRLNSEDPVERAAVLSELALTGGHDSFGLINKAFDDPSPEVRNAAARALYELRSDRTSSFIKAFRDASAERRCRIAGAVTDSGLAGDALVNLSSEDPDTAYDAFSLLFLIAKAGEVEALLQAVEEHPSIEIRQTLVQLLAQSGQTKVLPAFGRLAVRQSLPSEVRSALMEAIHQIRSEQLKTLPAAALLPGTSKNE